MIKKSVILLTLAALFCVSSGLFIRKRENEQFEDDSSKLIGKLNLTYPGKNLDLRVKFPSKFWASFREFDTNFVIEFVRVDHGHKEATGIEDDDIYVIDPKTGEPMLYEVNGDTEPYENYIQSHGDGFATLIRNKAYDAKNPFRLMATIFLNDTTKQAFDVYPVMIEKQDRQKRDTEEAVNRVFDSANNHHAVFRRSVEVPTKLFNPIAPYADEDSLEIESTSETIIRRKKRALNGQPIQLSAKVFVVAELTVFQSVLGFLNSNLADNAFVFMRYYYAHLMNGVNTRYANSLSNDADLRIRIYLTKYLFLLTSADTAWSVTSTYYNDKQVVFQNSALNAFRSYLNTKTFPFSYDMVVGFLNKDIWNDDSSQTAEQRSSATGYATVGTVCTNQAYAIVEDFGGLSNIITTAREIGHMLGAENDGVVGVSADCPTTNNNIMTPTPNATSNPLNLLTFSACSIRQFKSSLLNSALTATLPARQCLNTVPLSLPVEVSTNVDLALPGQIFSPNDQCQQIYGTSSSFCQLQSSSMCTSLACRVSSASDQCQSKPGGAMEGTICDSGKICLSGVCVTSSLASQDSCPFGDNGVTIYDLTAFGCSVPLTSFQLTCQQAFSVIAQNGQSISGFCSNSTFNSLCCQSCKKYNALSCRDLYPTCPSVLVSQCSTTLINGQLASIVCPRTCGTCSGGSVPQTCTSSTYICQNGGTCVNTGATIGLFGYTCSCPTGYTGELCETKVSCSSTSCQNGGTCLLTSYGKSTCLCPTGYTGVLCQNSASNCNPSLCSNGGTCVPTANGGYSCLCSLGFGGSDCKTPVQQTSCAPNLCRNGGTCDLSLNNTAYCRCPYGYTGIYCQTVANSCLQSPCANGGACLQLGTSLPSCACLTNFTGRYCEIKLNSCGASTNLCANGATCYADAYNNFICNCPDNCSGPTCSSCFATTTAATTTRSASPTCYDYYPSCSYFASLGFCSRDAYLGGVSIRVSCALSCNSCTIPTTTTQCPPTCVDSQANCVFWEKYCYLLPNPYMCARTCKLC